MSSEQSQDYNIQSDPIELVAYNSEWPLLAQQEIQKLSAALSEIGIIAIEHVGSTAIPNIKSKPIIDIQIAVAALPKIKQRAVAILSSLGYLYWDKNLDVEERMVFIKGLPPQGKKRSHHVHIVEAASKHWRDKILFRDYLNEHPASAQKYDYLKSELERKYKYDREKYTNAKTDFINQILTLAQMEKNGGEK